ncbi:phosphodiester glycosidase family protein [Georgenia faecalis]|uniref:Phosphodiester glycosidase family protein n=1 Tax=Georgenia faecalis TaxID=2483799 RepID=A0ABV9D828_9MICO|nr:phosphodiester glycosidase family protein [Georgenia faecalis]
MSSFTAERPGPGPHRARRALLAATVTATLVALPATAGAADSLAHHRGPHRPDSTELPLGAADLPETRTTEVLQPGVTLTRIVRGEVDPDHSWTVEVSIPGGATSPDPDAPPTVLKDLASAQETTAALVAAGFAARAEEVVTAPVADYAGGTLGWRVRVGSFADQAAATAERDRLRAAGFTGSVFYTGWDWEDDDRGPWRIDVITVDPRRFRGEIDATLGPDIEQRETTSALADLAGATAGVNGGYFVLDPRAGAPGDPAGVTVVDGELLSEPVDGRPALVLREDARHTDVARFSWEGEVRAGRTTLALDGINRVPGLIRNCGGTDDDLPTSDPRHDVTCTDDAELVLFTPEFAGTTPAGDGVEVVLDRRDTVVEVRQSRGGTVPRGGTTLQATGDLADDLRQVARRGARLDVRTALTDERGRTVRTHDHTSVVNGGPELVRRGRLHVTPASDGMVHADNPSFYYGWAHKRNPRTFAGTDAQGRLVLVTADGRSTESLGLSIPEAGQVAVGLGLREALNLDGGGSTTMVVDGAVINDPSDAAGERPVGDAILVLPDRRRH